MKKLVCLFVCFALFSCKTDKKKVSKTEDTLEKNKQWLTFEGSDKATKNVVLISGNEEYRSE